MQILADISIQVPNKWFVYVCVLTDLELFFLIHRIRTDDVSMNLWKTPPTLEENAQKHRIEMDV